MSVLKANRQESKFEIFENMANLRREITKDLLFNFGYDFEKSEERLRGFFSKYGSYDEMDSKHKKRLNRLIKQNDSFEDWFIITQRECISDCLRKMLSYVYEANSIYPVSGEEYIERRTLQSKAIGQCVTLKNELQYTIETLPIDSNKFARYTIMIDKQIDLIKRWKESDKRRFKDLGNF